MYRSLFLEYLNKVDSKSCVGKIFKSRSFGEFRVLNYFSWNNVEIEFLSTGYRKTCELKDLKKGSVKDLYLPIIYGQGYVGDKHKTCETVDGKVVNKKQYEHWRGMLRRCYNEEERYKTPTYKDCIVSENFKSYTYFYEWCNKQVGFNNKGWNLDKDLLVKGNKIYSEDNCVFLPPELNAILVKNNKIRGKYPIGVYYCKSKKLFVAQINRNKDQQDYLGAFNTPEEAFYAYKEAKEDFIKEQALKWKDKIDPRAYEALMNYEINVDD